ncbi:MAG TPA: thioredoxin domain-containing protein [Kofleriaceae bacterium]|nr:thioredoxin domain-containing protein [Kofleriaceae bacterium]
MKKLVLLSVVLAACQSDTKNLEKKIDDLNKKLDTMIARGGAGAAMPRPQQRPEPDRAKTYAVPVDGDPAEGPADAKVTLVKAYDYACGYCEKVRPTLDQLKQKYGKDLRIVFKQLVIHPKNAMVGALAFCAATKQGKGMEMDRLIWDKGFNARQLDLTDVPLTQPAQPAPGQAAPGQPPAPAPAQTVKCWDHPDGCKNVYGYAAELGLDMNRFKADMKDECTKLVASDGRHLSQFSVSSTPAFFINGRFLSGAQPIEQFSNLIDEELKKANERIAAGTPAASYYQQWVMDKGLKSLQQ